MSSSRDTPNANQRRAILWNDGPMLVLAGPGSGKTRVLTMRVVRLLQKDPDASVLALTFTNKAATEMRERVVERLGKHSNQAQLCTFHAYATEILRQHGSHLGLRPDFTILTLDEDRIALLEPIVRGLIEAGHTISADQHSLLRLLDFIFREPHSEEASVPRLATIPTWFQPLFEGYCSTLLAHNRQDFGSLLYFATRLLREKHGVARVIRLGWSHICVDEFQDTNKAQFEFLKLLAPPPRANLFVVGDDDQMIYQWNGANPDRLHALQRDYKMEVVQLPENYRCPSEIVDLANQLISHNKLRTQDKRPLAAQRDPSEAGDTFRCKKCSSPDEEANFVAQDIRARGIEAAECVVIARTTKLLERVAQKIQEAGLTAYLAKSKGDFESPPICVLVQALRLANARHDREILRRLCVAWQGLTGTIITVEETIASATLLGGDFLRAWVSIADRDNTDAGSFLSHLRSMLVDRLDFPGIVDQFLNESWTHWKKDFGDELSDEIAIWQKFHDQHISEYSPENITLYGYLQSLDLTSKVAPPPKDAVRCLTIHGSKGLEFKHVYLIGMAQGILPSFQALRKGADSREVEEERRNCFVAITRTQETLTLTRSTQYNGWLKETSQFFYEMTGYKRQADPPASASPKAT